MIKALKGTVSVFFTVVFAILLTACSGDLPASEPTLSSAYIPAASPSPIQTPMPTPTPLPTPVPTTEPPPEPVFTQPPHAEFDGSLPYWTMFYEYGPEMLAEHDWYGHAFGFTPATFEDLRGTHTGAEIKAALHETAWESIMTSNYDEQRWALSRSYEIEIGEAQTFFVDGELCETRTVTIMDTDSESAPSNSTIGHTLYFIRQNYSWHYPAQTLRYKFEVGKPQPIDEIADGLGFAQDAGQHDVCLVLTNHRQTENASWTRVDYLSLTERTPTIGYYTNVSAQSDDGWRIESNAAFDYRLADEGVIHLTVRQDAYDPEGNPQCGVTHYIEYEWNYMGNLERTSYRARFDDGYEVDYGVTNSYSFSVYDSAKSKPAEGFRYVPIKVPDIPEDAIGLEKFFEPKAGAGLYTSQARATDALLSMTPELAVDVLSERCGAHRDAPVKKEYSRSVVSQYFFTLSLENIERRAAWVTSPENYYSQEESFLFIEYNDGWKMAAVCDEYDYKYVSPFIVQSPDGQTAWFIDAVINGKSGDGYISWYNLVTGRIDVEYTSSYPSEAKEYTYSYWSKESYNHSGDSPFLRMYDEPLVITGLLDGYDGTAGSTNWTPNYTCEYKHTFVYAPETRSLVIQERKIQTSEGFSYEESFRLPAEVAPRMTPHEIETRPLTEEEMTSIRVGMGAPTEERWREGFSPLDLSPTEVESRFNSKTSIGISEIIKFFTEMKEQRHTIQYDNILGKLEEKRDSAVMPVRVWIEAYNERAFLYDKEADIRVCEFFLYESHTDVDELIYPPQYLSLRMYFVKTEGAWRLTNAIWIDEWHDERTETMIVGHENGQSIWLKETLPTYTGTGSGNKDVVWHNLLTGNIDFWYTMSLYSYMSLGEYDSFSVVYGEYEKMMPDGEPMTVLADTIFIQTGHVMYNLENYVSDTDFERKLDIQFHQTSELRFIPGYTPGYALVSYTVDVPINIRDNIVKRY